MQYCLCQPPPLVWGLTYFFANVVVDIRVGVGILPITKELPAQIFFWVACLCFKVIVFRFLL